MYINFEYLKSKELSYIDFICLQAISQNKIENLQELIEGIITDKIRDNYTITLKNGKYNLNDLGKDVLNNIEIVGYTENDGVLADYLIKKYKEKELILCSRPKLLKLITWFRGATKFTHKEIFYLIIEYFKTEESDYNKRLDYLFWKPENSYSKPNLTDSRLYTFYENNKEWLDKKIKHDEH